ncbi:MAG TPA: DNA polymerase I [Actinomycetota bacterium]|nr:DNA polymerase I [Actinomycetota bacterium]
MGAKKKAERRRKLLVLDGHSLVYRSFFALPETLVTSSGQVTNAVYGFTSMLIKLLADERPDGVAVCFDKGRPAFRYERFEEYKANRREQPDILREQWPLVREVLETMRIPIIEIEGYEADDLLATIAKEATEEGAELVIVSGDRDVLQLVDENVSVMMTRRGITDIARYDREGVIERYGVSPEQWTDFVALKGETSDNLPGVPGIGDKTAAKLVQTYGDIEGVIAHAADLTPKIRKGVEEMGDQLRINKELGRLLDDVPLEIGPSDIRLEPWDDEEVRKLYTSLEFKTLYERLKEYNLAPTPATAPALEVSKITPLAAGEEPVGEAGVAWDADFLAVCTQEGCASVAPLEEAIATFKDWLADPDRPKFVHDAKPLYRRTLEADGSLEGLAADTLIAAYLVEPGLPGGYVLGDVVQRYLGVSLSEEQPKAKRSKQAALDLEPAKPDRVATAAAAVHALGPVLVDRLQSRGIWDLATTLEFPLIGVLARMEHAGILVDREYLEELNEDLGGKMHGLERKIHERAGFEFNVNSNPQLQKILFEQFGLPKTKKIKTGWSTDQSELQRIREAHPIVEELIEYREVAKLKTGFTDALLPLIDPKTGRIHTTYLQASASTGRLASTNPNMQNIPIRGEQGRQIRRAFIAPDDHVVLSADYSQIELRVLGHLAQDEGILEAFASEHDFHAAIAAKVYGVDVSDVQPSMRDFAKQFSFGIAYGMSAYGVSQRLGIDAEEAQAFVEAYYAQFPKVKEFLDKQVGQARVDGFTTTMFGRRRYLPELDSSNFRVRAMGERMALNAPIQGSAADIIKRAMIDVDRYLTEHADLGRMLLTVHDELVFEIPRKKVEQATEAITQLMEGAAELRCRLAVEVHTGKNWAEAHA